jgi:predicted nuclease of predicted toxin-antitoxin system
VRFLLDQDVPDDIEYSLAALGHEVLKLREVLPRTAPDEEILRLAGERDAILITCNRDDFLAIAGQVPHAGLIILIRRRTHVHRRDARMRGARTWPSRPSRWRQRTRAGESHLQRPAHEPFDDGRDRSESID